MSARPRNPWYYPWAPLGVVAATVAAVVALALAGPPAQQAQAADVAPQNVAAFQTTEHLVLTVNLPADAKGRPTQTLRVELLDADGKVIASDETQAQLGDAPTAHRFEMKPTQLAPDKVTVRCTFGSQKTEAPLDKVLLVKAHETALSGGQEFFAGAPASLRCEVHGVKSFSETVPLAASVAIRLTDKDGKTTPVYEGKTGPEGVADVHFDMPSLPAGTYKMAVVTRSDLGEEKLERDVQVKTAPRVLLVTDKPLYQPGQLMHIRALALQSFDLKPVAGTDLTFEVEDGKGNKVFKQTMKTSDYGIASADFQLADEVNAGDYHVKAVLPDHTADKTVTVKPYVLPKFKADVTADRRFYLPKETIKADLQSDYFFGKPVANAKLHVTASTFDVAFKDFLTIDAKTDAQGHAKFEVQLPDYFIGQPLQKGDALVKVEVKITDTADHTETITRTYPVSDQPIRVSLLPEGGRVTPGLENRIFAAATYPDGSPAQAEVNLWIGKEPKDKPFTTLKTNEAGLAELKVTPKADQIRPGEWGQHNIEMLGGQQQIWSPQNLFDLYAEAFDAKGATAKTAVTLNTEAMGENVLLRLDKAVYKAGEAVKLDVRTSAGLPTAYLDVVRSGQTVLTKWLDVKDGRADYTLDLPQSLFGTLEIHAYQMLGSGEIIRDARVVYVQPGEDLKIDVQADRDVYLPGSEGRITFRVTDAAGKPTAAALGVLVVDEAVYALQDMQPGLEKVYFTLQEELLKPQAQVLYKPSETVDALVRQPALTAGQQQIAEALLTSVKPKPPAHWDVNPVVERRQKIQGQLSQIGWAIYNHAQQNKQVFAKDEDAKGLSFKPELLKELVDARQLDPSVLTDPVGGKLTLDSIAKVEKDFTADKLGAAVTNIRVYQLRQAVINYTAQPERAKQYMKDGHWVLSDSLMADAAKAQGVGAEQLKDAWGRPLQLVKRENKWVDPQGGTQFEEYDIVSAGPDGKFGTDDDVKLSTGLANPWRYGQNWWADLDDQVAEGLDRNAAWGMRNRGLLLREERLELAADADAKAGAFRGPFPPGALIPGAAPGAGLPPMAANKPHGLPTNGPGASGQGSEGAPVRLREYFPETLFWQPSLITDDKGMAVMPLPFADSITTWRLTASASSKAGALGGVSAPLRVFQDFFVDIDLPTALTQNDEVAFPVAVYNYLKNPQTVTLDLQQEDWFALTDGQGLTRTLDLKANEVTSVKYRIRASKIGRFALTVKAAGTKMSDAVKRQIDVSPDGKPIEQVVTDRLNGHAEQTIAIPPDALADATKLFVKIHPGVFSQVMEGADGILRMPGGCFEQTSSSAYPNVLAVDYMKRTHTENPAAMMKAEQYLNAGYQRLLTFEHKSGGFDWWGREENEPLIWVSAYGLQEFNDMSKVYPVDHGVIDRTQAWLMKQQAADGAWEKIGMTHNETIASMGDPKLLLTSYVTWALLDSGLKSPQLDKSIAYVRDHAKDSENAYVLALAANALAAWDAKDDATHDVLVRVLKKLDGMQEPRPDWKAIAFPTKGESLAYARGESLTVETTALACLAMLRSGQFPNDLNKALVYLVKSKGPGGTWGSTSATVLSLKALIRAAGGSQQKGTAAFTIAVNGKEAAKGEITEQNADVMQVFDLKDFAQSGANTVTLDVKGETGAMYQIVSRHYESWPKEAPQKPLLEVSVDYDRTRLTTSDILEATATLKYNGQEPTAMVMLDLGIPPGFTADAGDFAEMVGAKKVQKFSLTERQAILYLGDVDPGKAYTFKYTLRPKYPVKAKTPSSTAYEYYTPEHRATAAPVELTVDEAKK